MLRDGSLMAASPWPGDRPADSEQESKNTWLCIEPLALSSVSRTGLALDRPTTATVVPRMSRVKDMLDDRPRNLRVSMAWMAKG